MITENVFMMLRFSIFGRTSGYNDDKCMENKTALKALLLKIMRFRRIPSYQHAMKCVFLCFSI